MIVSHKHRLIFLKPHKVAGTSFEIALSKFLGDRDIITPISPDDENTRRELGFRTAQNYRYELKEMFLALGATSMIRAALRRELPVKFYNHIAADLGRARVGTAMWDDYLKVSIVRNPWDVIVSLFYYSIRQDAARPEFASWCLENPEVAGQNTEQYLVDGVPVIDIFLRFENFEEDINALEQRCPGLLGLYETFSKIRAKHGLRPGHSRDLMRVFRDLPEFSRLIKLASRFEIEKFGYELE